MDDPDFLIVKRILSEKNSDSFNLLVKKYEDLVFNFCFRFLGNRDDAVDCTQEIFIKIYENLGGFRFHSAFSTWLYKIMLNSCRDLANWRKKRHGQVKNSDYEFYNGNPENAATADRDSPDIIMMREEINIAFQNAVSKLKEINRSVLILRDIDGKSYSEISSITGLRTGTVRSKLARARCQVAKELKIFRYEL